MSASKAEILAPKVTQVWSALLGSQDRGETFVRKLSLVAGVDDNELVQCYKDALLDAKDSIDKQQIITPRLKDRSNIKAKSVDPKTFLLDPYYLGIDKESLYPKVLEAFIEVNNGSYVEGVFVGGIGSAKTTLAVWTTLYQLYLLSLMKNPHKVLGIESSAEILFIFQSINTALAKDVDYARFKAAIETSPYF